MPADATDEYFRIRESTVLKCFAIGLRRFTKAVIALFGEEYLRPPNENHTARLLALVEDRGFPVMLGSIEDQLIACIGVGRIALQHDKVCTLNIITSQQ
jgi:hypothetical protein